MHQIQLIGNIGRDAVIRQAGDKQVISFSVAVNETYRKGGEKIEKTTWYSCSFWPRTEAQLKRADVLKAGQQVYVQGTPAPHLYQDGSQQYHAEIEVRVDALELTGSKPAAKEGAEGAPAEASAGPASPADDDNDLPF